MFNISKIVDINSSIMKDINVIVKYIKENLIVKEIN
jgi:hypothetical protein